MPVDAPAGSYEVAGIPAAQRQQQIRALQAEITALETEKARIQALIDQYYRRFRQQFGELLRQIIQLQGHLATRRAGQSRRRSDAEVANDYRARYEQTQRKLEEALAHAPAEPDAIAAADLRHLYRQAVAVAHPDRFFNDPHRMAQATEFMARLNNAYQRQDLATVRHLAQQLQAGFLFMDDAPQTDPHALQRWFEQLIGQKLTLEADIQALVREEAHIIMTGSPTAQNDHFDQLQKNIWQQLNELTQQCQNP